jgi:O-antigen/teichoic acid export membrane protein
MVDGTRPSLEHQLLSNQVWETVAFVAKAAFMLGLTPWMIRTWGKVGYGEFALASSAFIFLSLFDFGIRGRTRVALSKEIVANSKNASLLLRGSLLAFGSISLVVLLLTGAVTIFHGWSHLFGIRRDHESLLLVTTALTMPFMFSTILLEPIVARGGVGKVKSAAAAGWVLAIPAVAVVLWRGDSVVVAIASWLGALLLANLCLLAAHCRQERVFLKSWHAIPRDQFLSVFRESLWFSVASLTWAAKSHGLTLLLGALSGPVTAGIFFIVLRLSEIVSALGAISSDVALAALPRCRSAAERRHCLMATSRYASFFALPCAGAIAILAPAFFSLWLGIAAPLGWQTGIWIAGLGLAIALNRFVTYVALGMGIGRTVALCGAAEIAITVGGISLFQPLVGLAGSLGVIIIAVVAYSPLVWVIHGKLTTRRLDEDRAAGSVPLAPCATSAVTCQSRQFFG